MAASASVVPTFFVIGAPKSGTTSLHLYLSRHPQIDMTRVKEPQVFAGDDWAERLGEYGRLFAAPGAPARGESSAVYSQHPRWPRVPARIRDRIPDAKFVYLVRDPVERALAHYREHVLNGKEDRAAPDALADYEDPHSLYVSASRYGVQVREYLASFPADSIYVVSQRDLLDRRHETLASIFSFLGVDPQFRAGSFEEELNVGDERRAPTAVGRRLRGTRVYRAVQSLPVKGRARAALRSVVMGRVDRPEIDSGLRARLEESLRPEAEWLRSFCGHEFDDWSV